jgi:hypothetical protein
MSWTRLGVRYRKVRSRDSRWGKGKVHVESYDRVSKTWWPICVASGRGAWIGMGWEEVGEKAKVECTKCLKSEQAWKRKQ